MAIDLNGGDGSVAVSEPPELDLKIDMVGSDSGLASWENGVETLVSFLYGGTSPFTLAGSWTYETLDHPGLDTFGYHVDGTSSDLSEPWIGMNEQSGTFSFMVNPGGTFGFYINSWDDFGGRAWASVQVEKGVFPIPAPVPLPASLALMLPALGALALMRRNARAKS